MRRESAFSQRIAVAACWLAAPAGVALAAPAEPTACDTVHSRMGLGRCRCECTFIDAGLNNGRSLTQWPRDALDGKRGKLPDAMRAKLSRCLATESKATTCYYGFEGNGAWTQKLAAIENHLRATGTPAKVFTQTLFSVDSKPQMFHVDPMRDHLGSSIALRQVTVLRSKAEQRAHPNESHYADGAPLSPSGSTRAPGVGTWRSIETPAVDAGKFLAEVIKASGFVAAKIDIEGFEFTLLPHLLFHHPRVLCSLDLAAIEWHEFIFPKKDDVERIGVPVVGASQHLQWVLSHPMCNVSLLAWD